MRKGVVILNEVKDLTYDIGHTMKLVYRQLQVRDPSLRSG
jgi:hypothetical protein